MTVSLPKEFLANEVTVEFIDGSDVTGRIVSFNGNPHHFILQNSTYRYVVLWDKVVDLRILPTQNIKKEGSE